jgi:hypothetical protein
MARCGAARPLFTGTPKSSVRTGVFYSLHEL